MRRNEMGWSDQRSLLEEMTWALSPAGTKLGESPGLGRMRAPGCLRTQRRLVRWLLIWKDRAAARSQQDVSCGALEAAAGNLTSIQVFSQGRAYLGWRVTLSELLLMIAASCLPGP